MDPVGKPVKVQLPNTCEKQAIITILLEDQTERIITIIHSAQQLGELSFRDSLQEWLKLHLYTAVFDREQSFTRLTICDN